MSDERQRFEDLCFLYACGKAAAEDAAWIAQMLVQHPDWQGLLEVEHALVQAGRTAQAQRRARQPELLSDADIMALADIANAEADAQAGAPRPQAPAPTRPGLLDVLRAWWQRPLQGGYAYTAMALLALAVSVQTYRVEQPPPGSRYRGVPAASTAAQLRVLFDDRVSAGELRTRLTALGLSIVHGPDRNGAYLLSAGGDPARAAAQLQAAHLVLDVQLLSPSQRGQAQ